MQAEIKKTQGGLAILVKNYIPARVREEFLYLNTEMLFESCIVECFLPNNEKILIAVIYRPPSSSMVDFIDKLENILSAISNLRMPFFILGDFDIDLMGCPPIKPAKD